MPPFAPEGPGDRFLVSRIGIRMEQADGHRLDLKSSQSPSESLEGVGVKRDHDLSPGPGPLRQTESQSGRDPDSPNGGIQAVQFGSRLAPQDEEIFKPPRTHEGRSATPPLQKGVGGYGGSVDDGDRP